MIIITTMMMMMMMMLVLFMPLVMIIASEALCIPSFSSNNYNNDSIIYANDDSNDSNDDRVTIICRLQQIDIQPMRFDWCDHNTINDNNLDRALVLNVFSENGLNHSIKSPILHDEISSLIYDYNPSTSCNTLRLGSSIDYVAHRNNTEFIVWLEYPRQYYVDSLFKPTLSDGRYQQDSVSSQTSPHQTTPKLLATCGGYQTGICSSGYFQVVSDIRYWACGKDCPGAPYYTDNRCKCVCLTCSEILQIFPTPAPTPVFIVPSKYQVVVGSSIVNTQPGANYQYTTSLFQSIVQRSTTLNQEWLLGRFSNYDTISGIFNISEGDICFGRKRRSGLVELLCHDTSRIIVNEGPTCFYRIKVFNSLFCFGPSSAPTVQPTSPTTTPTHLPTSPTAAPTFLPSASPLVQVFEIPKNYISLSGLLLKSKLYPYGMPNERFRYSMNLFNCISRLTLQDDDVVLMEEIGCFQSYDAKKDIFYLHGGSRCNSNALNTGQIKLLCSSNSEVAYTENPSSCYATMQYKDPKLCIKKSEGSKSSGSAVMVTILLLLFCLCLCVSGVRIMRRRLSINMSRVTPDPIPIYFSDENEPHQQPDSPATVLEMTQRHYAANQYNFDQNAEPIASLWNPEAGQNIRRGTHPSRRNDESASTQTWGRYDNRIIAESTIGVPASISPVVAVAIDVNEMRSGRFRNIPTTEAIALHPGNSNVPVIPAEAIVIVR